MSNADAFVSDFDEQDPLLGVPFGVAELRASIAETTRALAHPETPPEALGGLATHLATALQVLPEVIVTEQGFPQSPELIEQEVSEAAVSAHDSLTASKRRAVDPRIARSLGALTKTPVKDARERAEAEATQAEKLQEIDHLLEAISNEERSYKLNTKKKRAQQYIVDGDKKNNPWLAQKTGEITDDGSRDTQFRYFLFSANEAELLANIALSGLTPERLAAIRSSLDTILTYHKEIKKLGGAGAKHGLLSGLMTLKELYESEDASRLKNDANLRPLYRLAEALFQESSANEEVIDTLYEGPFAHCEVIEVVPFQGKEKGSTVVIDSESVTEENILDDIKKAVARSKGNYHVMEERITDFIELRQQVMDVYGGENVTIYRTLRPKLHLLPWYVIQVKKPGQQEQPHIAVVESPIYGNATYALNPPEKSWLEVLGMKRRGELRQEKGTRSFMHIPESPITHVQKLSAHIRKAMD